jgi:hypothetical protein
MTLYKDKPMESRIGFWRRCWQGGAERMKGLKMSKTASWISFLGE